MNDRERDVGCEEHVDAAPYALGALEPDEADRFRRHIATCPSCRAEVAELQLAVDALPVAVPPAASSEALRERVLATVRSEAELLWAAGHRADDPPALAGRRRYRRLPVLAAVGAVVASAAVAAVIASGGASPTREKVTSAQISASLPGAYASVRQLDGHAELTVSHMPQPPAGRIYEVWLNRGGASPQPTDALFGVTGAGRGSVNIPGGVRGVEEVLVTSEPLGGSLHPTRPPVIRVPLDT
jgi:anti-sigma-K factor RskA